MEIVLDKQNTTNASIKIKLNEADYQPKVTEKLKEYGKKAAIKGFRPGKVPPALIKKMFGKGILIDEINQLLVDSVNGYIKENKLPIVGDPLPEKEEADKIDWDNQKEFEFRYSVGLVPEFNYNLQALNLTQYDVQVSDEELEQTFDNLRKRYGQYAHPETVAEGDFVIGSLKAVEGDFQKENVFLSLERVKPDQRGNFIGKTKGDVVTLDLQNTFEKPEHIAFFTGVSKEETDKLTGDYELTITDVERMEPAELNQEFFDKVLGKDAVADEEAFRSKIREIMGENYQKDAESLLTQQIKDQLVENTAIELPDDFLKRWLQVANEKVTPEQIESEYEEYVKELKWSLIKNRIAEDAGLKVEHEDVLDRTKQLIRDQFGAAGMFEEEDDRLNSLANNFLQSEKGKNYMNIFNQLFADKVTAYIQQNATLNSQQVSADAFKAVREK